MSQPLLPRGAPRTIVGALSAIFQATARRAGRYHRQRGVQRSTRMPSTLLRVVVVSCLLVASSVAHAQTFGRTVVLPHGAGDAQPAQLSAQAVETALAARRVPIISLHDARDRFISRSRPPLVADESDVDILAKEARNAIEHVAFGRAAAAQRSVREVLTRAERALESLNRETSTARQVLDACLALVRSALQKDDRREALGQAMACRRLVPDVGPNENLHPASVIGVLAEADDQLRRLRIGRLTVNSLPESSCAVYLNGRHLGTTPFLLERAAAGSYRVQVECGEARGRVHIVDLGEEPVELQVDTEYDKAVRSEPRLYLSQQGAVRPQVLARHAELTGRAIKADDVVLVGRSGDTVELSRVNVKQARVVARVTLPFSGDVFDRSQLQQALDTLAQGRIEVAAVEASVAVAVPVATASVVSVVAPAREDTSREKLSPRALRWIGGSMAGVGVGALAVGLAFEVRTERLENEASRLEVGDPRLLDKDDEYDTASSLRWIGVGGGVLTAAAVPLLVKPRASVPWWSWAVGGAGVVAAGVGAWQLAIATQCQLPNADGTCFSEENTEGRGALLLGAAAPLVAVPLSHLLLQRRVEVAPSAGRSHAAITLRIAM
jgi:hypothetical protein